MHVQLWTSMFTLAEVYKRACDGDQKSLLPKQDKTFEDLILQPYVERVQVDYHVGVTARRLLRAHPTIQKPQDGIHLATALLSECDQLHTFDRANLLDLSEAIECPSGKKLKICHPPKRPKPEPLPLFEKLETDDEAINKEAAQGGASA